MRQLDKENEHQTSNILNELQQMQNMPVILKKLTKIEDMSHARLLHSELYNSFGYQCLESYKPISLLIRSKVISNESH